MLSWSRWRSVRRRWGSAATGSFSAWSATGSPLVSYIPSQSQYHRRLRALTGLLTVVQQRLARLLDAGGARLTDGTLIGVANYAGSAAHSEFAGVAAYGFCASKSEWVWGGRLVLRTDRRGLPLSYTLVPANEHEYEPLLDLVDSDETVIADKGASGAAPTTRGCSASRCCSPRPANESPPTTAGNAPSPVSG
jgi:IS5 family transposase